MTSQNSPSRPQLLGLIDAAACPARIQPLLDQSEATYLSVFAGLPEEVLGPASLFLVRIDDPEATWVAELDQIDLNSPCMSLIWSRVSLSIMRYPSTTGESYLAVTGRIPSHVWEDLARRHDMRMNAGQRPQTLGPHDEKARECEARQTQRRC